MDKYKPEKNEKNEKILTRTHKHNYKKHKNMILSNQRKIEINYLKEQFDLHKTHL